MKKLNALGLSVVLGVMSAGAYADNFTYVDYGYGVIDPDNISSDGTYSSLSGAVELGSPYFIAVELTNYKDTGIYDTNITAVGLGAYVPMGTFSTIYGIAQIVDSDETSDNYDMRLTAGIRSTISDRVELEGKIKFDDVEDNTDTSYVGTVRYYFTSQLSLAGNYESSDDYQRDMMYASVRYAFK